ncbi:MAG: C-terminal helicase domain-containing protein [Oscillospiraceae bacterium]
MCGTCETRRSTSGHKVLLFSQFTSVLDEIEKALAKEKIEDHRIDGSVSKEQRIRLVDSFETDDVPVFCISLKAVVVQD